MLITNGIKPILQKVSGEISKETSNLLSKSLKNNERFEFNYVFTKINFLQIIKTKLLKIN